MSSKLRKVIVTGGPTREWIDPVRYISNASSGKMGVALADIAHRKGYATIFIHGPIDAQLVRDKPYAVKSIQTTAELLAEVLSELENDCILIMAAAPADYRPEEKLAEKIKKTGDELIIKLRKNPDILKQVAKKKTDLGLEHLLVVGFAAETNNVEEYALGKLQAKKLDMICLNDVTQEGAGFGTDTNIMVLFKKDGEKIPLPILSKEKVAERIIAEIEDIAQKNKD